MALDPTALFNLSYGLYVLTAREDGRDCGCIVNTVTQLTETPRASRSASTSRTSPTR